MIQVIVIKKILNYFIINNLENYWSLSKEKIIWVPVSNCFLYGLGLFRNNSSIMCTIHHHYRHFLHFSIYYQKVNFCQKFSSKMLQNWSILTIYFQYKNNLNTIATNKLGLSCAKFMLSLACKLGKLCLKRVSCYWNFATLFGTCFEFRLG